MRLSLSTQTLCESILFVLLETLRGSERRVVRIVGMVGLTLDDKGVQEPVSSEISDLQNF